ncbi:MAG: TVP38/TMEM64 family protein [Alphaproteobacteria bacterium]|nr:TVP38/TMEM64 family protein [Alphaproteobacteria bacterium]
MPDRLPLIPVRPRLGLWLRRVVLPLLFLGAALALWRSGALADLDVEGVRAHIASAGAWGPVLYLLLFALLQPFGLSGHVFVLTAALVWPPQAALPLAWAGSMLAASVAFATSRYLARDFIQARVPPKLRRWDDALAERGIRTVIVLRLIFWTTFLVQLSMGLSKLRWRDYLIGSAIGNLPVIVLEVFFGDQLFGWLGS